MKKFGMKCPIRKANPYKKISKAIGENNFAPNLLNREFTPGQPNNRKCKAYLSAIKNSQTKEILAYYLSRSLEMPLVINTIEILMHHKTFKVNENTILHSDQGCHYNSRIYRELLDLFGIKHSMSRRRNCWDNAPMKSFFGHFKQEADYKSIRKFDELEN